MCKIWKAIKFNGYFVGENRILNVIYFILQSKNVGSGNLSLSQFSILSMKFVNGHQLLKMVPAKAKELF